MTEVSDRLLDTADRLWYAEGIRAVGVDRVIDAAGVSKASFYRHFRSKDDLICAYLARRDLQIRDTAERIVEVLAPVQVIEALVTGIGAEVCAPGFRGCPFINAAAEYADPSHPVRVVVAEHRAWFHRTLTDLVARAGDAAPEQTATTLAMLRDGAMVGGYLDGPDAVRDALAVSCADLVTAHGLGG